MSYLEQDDLCLKSQLTNNPISKLAYGSWTMYEDQGILNISPLEMSLAERNLGLSKALSIQKGKRGYIATETTQDIEDHLQSYDELAFELNQKYISLTNPNPIEQVFIPSSSDILQKKLEIRKMLSSLLSQGVAILPDRNSSTIKAFIPPQSLSATYSLNDKAYFTNLLRSNDLEVPESQIIDISMAEIDNILSSNDSSLQDILQSIIKTDTTIFLKISAQAGGHGVLRLPTQDTEEIKRFFLEYKQCISSNSQIKLIACSAVLRSSSLPELEVLADIIEYVDSPCLTLAMTQEAFQYGQVGAQVLKGGTTYIGSLWDANVDANFQAQQGVNISKLVAAVQSTGYQGLFGTDYIYNSDNIYQLIADGNARANGSHLSLFYRRSLQNQGLQVTRTFQSVFKIDGLNIQHLKEFALSHDGDGLISGAILIPSYSSDFAQQNSQDLAFHSVYINPQLDPSKFENFQKINS